MTFDRFIRLAWLAVALLALWIFAHWSPSVRVRHSGDLQINRGY